MTDYSLMNAALEGLVEGVPHTVANLANASALLNDMMENIN